MIIILTWFFETSNYLYKNKYKQYIGAKQMRRTDRQTDIGKKKLIIKLVDGLKGRKVLQSEAKLALKFIFAW